MRLFHGSPFNPPCDADATDQGESHGLQWGMEIVSIFLTMSYEVPICGQNATHAALFRVQFTATHRGDGVERGAVGGLLCIGVCDVFGTDLT
jgi:hypothetical protein